MVLRRSLWQSFSIVPPLQALRGLPCLGSLLCCLECQAHKRPRALTSQPPCCLGSYSADRHIRHLKGHLGGVLLCSSVLRSLMGQPLYCSAANPGVRGKRGYGDGSTPYVWVSSITLLPWLPNFPPQAFVSTVSSLQSISQQATAALTLGFLHNPLPPALSCCSFQGTSILVGVWISAARAAWFSFHLGFCGS